MENEAINKKIWNIWMEYPDKEKTGQYPVLYSKFAGKGILFIGLNPTSSDNYLNKILKRNGGSFQGCDSPKKIQEKLENKKNPDIIPFLISLEAEANKVSPLMNLKEFCDGIKVPYQHIDLFYFRDKNQNAAKEKIMISVGKDKKDYELTAFAIDQLKIAIDMIEKIKPKVIVVINALSSDIIKSIPGSEIDNPSGRFEISDEAFFDENGYDLLEINKKKIPILFSSTLSGQRQLDSHSFRRLKWHIKKILSPHTA